MIKHKVLTLLVLLMTAVSGAWAETITVKYALKAGDTFTSGQTVEVKNDAEEVVATITYGESGGADFNGANDDSNVSGYTAYTNGNGTNGDKADGTFYTITPKVDATITVAVVLNADKKFYIEEDGTALADYNGITVSARYYGTYEFDATANKAYKVYSAGSKLGFYGFAMTYSPVVPVTDPATKYNLTLADGTEDADKWQGKAGEGEYQALPLEGVAAGTAVSFKYFGTKKVESVKAVKKAKPAATVTTAPTAKTGVKAGEDVAIVNEGAAEGGTMMYMVNATQPASTDGFSATVPTAEGLTAGTYYVWYYVKADDSHTDSEISASGIEVTIAAAETTVTWNFSEMSGPTDLYGGYTYKDVTLSGAGELDLDAGFLVVYGSLTFTAPAGKHFKKIVINATNANINGGGWSGGTWTGDASSVSFNGDADGLTSIVFTLE